MFDKASTTPRGLPIPNRQRLTGAALILALVAAGSLAHAQDGTATDPSNGTLQQQGSAAPASDPAPSATPAGDPPARVLRLGTLNGDVSFEPGSVNTFSAAELNEVLTTGDRLYTDPAAAADLQGDQLAVRLGGGTDLTVTAMTDTLAQFGLATGSVHLRAFAVAPGTILELDTPEIAITVLQPGDLRVDEDPANHATTVELLSGSVQVDGPQLSQVLTPGERIRVDGGDPATGQQPSLQPLPPASPDALDSFDASQDQAYASGADAGSPYLNADTVGAGDLAGFGDWDTCDDGPVWFPAVAVDWVPYRYGHWRWHAPWGWTWVESEPWGFAPFHYGRWINWHGRWGWIPGPPSLRPVYAPALVAFAGGAQFAASVGYAPGFAITAWFPLGPREPYAPWYHGSTLYLNRVNAGDIYDPDTAQARAFYNQRAVNVFTAPPARTYADRLAATTAMPQTGFAAGRSALNGSLHIPAETLAAAPVLAHPTVNPERSMVTGAPPRALPPSLTRPAPNSAAEGAGSTPVGGVLFFQRAQPPAPAPSFDGQRRAMGGSDPGRPLSPAQLDNLRANRPVGPPAGREAMPHSPAPRSAPPAKAAAPPSPGFTKH